MEQTEARMLVLSAVTARRTLNLDTQYVNPRIELMHKYEKSDSFNFKFRLKALFRARVLLPIPHR